MRKTLAFSFLSPCLVTALTNSHTGIAPCDALAENDLGELVLLATDSGYEERLQTYWSVSARLKPWCIVQPRTTDEVSKVLKTLLDTGSGAGSWHIAVRGGGHSHWAGSSNVANGVAIDLGLLNRTEYDEATNIASVGGGALWNSAYEAAAQHSVSLVGSRAGGVGVSGFLLGGGNFYYTGQRGFGCDNVVNYEVVLTDGKIVNANATSNEDLYRALKGGGSNFGIVTRFDLEAFPAQDLYGGSRTISTNYTDDILDAVVSFANHDESEAADSFTPTFIYNTAISPDIIIDASVLNVEGLGNSTGFNRITSIPAVSEDLRTRNLVTIAADSTVEGTSRQANSHV
ncbi:FAD-binding PCMH-type domain-containing protein [Fusarium sp. Ph1]|nr:FAD-binding PCMH-type domain-containing protein [Fusarium sp. Ph1]